MKQINLAVDINKEDFKRKLDIKDGKTPTPEELTDLILPLIPEVKDGYTPTKGVDYFDGKPGKNGSPDTPKQIKAKLLKEGLNYEELSNLPDIEKIARIAGKQSSKTVSIGELENVDVSHTQTEGGKYILGNSWDKPYGSATFTYDIDGNIETKLVGDTELTYAYDVDGNVESITNGTYTKSFVYNVDGDVEAINYS
jgi:hypothetical protein